MYKHRLRHVGLHFLNKRTFSFFNTQNGSYFQDGVRISVNLQIFVKFTIPNRENLVHDKWKNDSLNERYQETQQNKILTFDENRKSQIRE